MHSKLFINTNLTRELTPTLSPLEKAIIDVNSIYSSIMMEEEFGRGLYHSKISETFKSPLKPTPINLFSQLAQLPLINKKAAETPMTPCSPTTSPVAEFQLHEEDLINRLFTPKRLDNGIN
jgi:hypothetical protein